MKHIIFLLAVIVLPSTFVWAQSTKQVTPANTAWHSSITTQKQFTTKQAEFNSNLKHNNNTKAQAAFEELRAAIQSSLVDTKLKISNAVTADIRNAERKVFMDKQTVLAKVNELSEDIAANQQALDQQFTAFVAMMK